jgi:hypothetical protein
MQHSYSESSHDSESSAASGTPPLTPVDAVVCEPKNGVTEEYKDFDQQYIMLDGGIFVRTAATREDNHQQTASSHVPASGVSVPPDFASDATHAFSPRLLIVPHHKMAVDSVSFAFSVGSHSFLVSPTCVDSHGGLLSILDGNLDLGNDGDGALMLWCSWFVVSIFLGGFQLRAACILFCCGSPFVVTLVSGV